MLMMLSTCLIKMSILDFYTKLFPQPWLQRICHLQIAILALFIIAQIVPMLAICQPFESIYDFSIPGKCGNIAGFWLSVSILAVLFGLACVLTPMPVVWKLQLSQEKRVKLTVLFGLGFWSVHDSLPARLEVANRK
jgi:hypothetical protein